MSKEIDINDPFLAEKEAIRYVKQFEECDKFSFITGFRHAMKLVKESDIIDLVSNQRELMILTAQYCMSDGLSNETANEIVDEVLKNQ